MYFKNNVAIFSGLNFSHESKKVNFKKYFYIWAAHLPNRLPWVDKTTNRKNNKCLFFKISLKINIFEIIIIGVVYIGSDWFLKIKNYETVASEINFINWQPKNTFNRFKPN